MTISREIASISQISTQAEQKPTSAALTTAAPLAIATDMSSTLITEVLTPSLNLVDFAAEEDPLTTDEEEVNIDKEINIYITEWLDHLTANTTTPPLNAKGLRKGNKLSVRSSQEVCPCFLEVNIQFIGAIETTQDEPDSSTDYYELKNTKDKVWELSFVSQQGKSRESINLKQISILANILKTRSLHDLNEDENKSGQACTKKRIQSLIRNYHSTKEQEKSKGYFKDFNSSDQQLKNARWLNEAIVGKTALLVSSMLRNTFLTPDYQLVINDQQELSGIFVKAIEFHPLEDFGNNEENLIKAIALGLGNISGFDYCMVNPDASRHNIGYNNSGDKLSSLDYGLANYFFLLEHDFLTAKEKQFITSERTNQLFNPVQLPQILLGPLQTLSYKADITETPADSYYISTITEPQTTTTAYTNTTTESKTTTTHANTSIKPRTTTTTHTRDGRNTPSDNNTDDNGYLAHHCFLDFDDHIHAITITQPEIAERFHSQIRLVMRLTAHLLIHPWYKKFINNSLGIDFLDHQCQKVTQLIIEELSRRGHYIINNLIHIDSLTMDMINSELQQLHIEDRAVSPFLRRYSTSDDDHRSMLNHTPTTQFSNSKASSPLTLPSAAKSTRSYGELTISASTSAELGPRFFTKARSSSISDDNNNVSTLCSPLPT